MVAQFIAKFKLGPGGLYILPADEENLRCEFVYVVDFDERTVLIEQAFAHLSQLCLVALWTLFAKQPRQGHLSVTSWQGDGEQRNEPMDPETFRRFCCTVEGLDEAEPKKARACRSERRRSSPGCRRAVSPFTSGKASSPASG